jgi:uncharacterized membrane protein
MRFWILLHLLGIVVWVGGMFFAYMALRPVAAKLLEPPQRLQLWAGTFAKFFPWVWIAVAMILISGLAMIMRLGGFSGLSWPVHAMFLMGLVMILIFMHVFFAPYGRLKRSVAVQDWKAAGAALVQIRMMIGLNLSLGLINVLLGVIGK